MPISIDWGARVIFVPQADLTPISIGLFELDLNVFRLSLKALEASDDGMAFPDTHVHTTVSSLGAARQVEIINGYTVTFEDGQYAVRLVGANTNVHDVTNVNSVSVRPTNSFGLVSQDALVAGQTAIESRVTALETLVQEIQMITGLEPGVPMELSPTQRSAGGIVLAITRVGNTVTVTRQA